MDEKKISVNGVDIIWRRKPSKYDSRHLVIVFSGFGASSEFTYDFMSSMDSVSAEVIWIKDDFGGHACYYSSAQQQNTISDAIEVFIHRRLSELNLSKKECTLVGASKGGSAALCHGLIYGYVNIIASVPQLLRGSYLKSHWPINYKHLFPKDDDSRLRAFDLEIADTLEKCDPEKNIYLVTSYADEQFDVQIKPFIDRFRRIKNFNYILANSPLVYQHNMVTSYCTPTILSLLNLLCAGLIPRLSENEMAFFTPVVPDRAIATPIVDLRQAHFSGSSFFPQGVAALRGVACQDYGDINLRLILEQGRSRIELLLAKDHRPALTRELFDGTLVRYDKAWFCTLRHEGIDLSSVPDGKYDAKIEIRAGGHRRIAPLRSEVPFVAQSMGEKGLYQIQAHRGGSALMIERERRQAS